MRNRFVFGLGFVASKHVEVVLVLLLQANSLAGEFFLNFVLLV